MQLPIQQPPAESTWYDNGLKFTCTQCGNCCTGDPGYVWVSDEEVSRMAVHLKLPEADLLRRHFRKIGGNLSLKERRNTRGEYDCIFLAEINGRRVCTVYEVRPLQCRTWPFWDGNLISPKSWERAGSKCPGMNKGRRFSRAEIEKMRDAADWPDRPPSSEQPTVKVRY